MATHVRPSSSTRSPWRSLALAVGLAASIALVGCSGEDKAGGQRECIAVAPVDGVTELTVTGKNLAFDHECFDIQPGKVEFTFVNADQGVSHNLHVSGPGGVNERTDLERGETTQVLELELTEPGRYDFVCDPHATMEGQLNVADPSTASTTTVAG
ncbi:MAG: cupredoxin domain-containing protein [Microthrixaceae bacterium]|jgi:plastocyanin|nr:cupredoxin domain-containing protein [Microthrixaceae bacterium]